MTTDADPGRKRTIRSLISHVMWLESEVTALVRRLDEVEARIVAVEANSLIGDAGLTLLLGSNDPRPGPAVQPHPDPVADTSEEE